MRNTIRGAILAGLLALGLSACGGSTATEGKRGGTVTIVSTAAPDSVDPQLGSTGLAREAFWNVYTPLLTVKHADGDAGMEVIPGLATALPEISDGGRTYTLTLRKGRRYSDGSPVKASDFRHAIERALRLNWPEASLFTVNIVGASEYLARKARRIDGIATDNRTGRVTIRLKAPFGPFAAVLALPSAAPVPGDTPFKPQNTQPPPGDGPFMFKSATPNGGFALVRNPHYKQLPGLPTPKIASVRLSVNSNVQAAAEQVLSNQVDVFDASSVVPPIVLRKVRSRASDRFTAPPAPSTNFFFFNVERPPFDNVDARRAALAALDPEALSRLGSGLLEPGCHLTPTTLVGHPQEPCPRPDLARAKQLLARSGLAGAPVTVWGPNVSPRRQWVSYVAQQLRAVGFDAREKLLTPNIYYSTVGNPKTRAQMGFVNWAASYPHPSIMWTAMLSSSGPAANMGRVSDPRIDATAGRLTREPLERLKQSAGAWEELDRYGRDQAYYAAFGYQKYLKFFSDRLDFDKAVFSPLFQNDYASFELK